MLDCDHEGPAAEAPVCTHLLGATSAVKYVRWYVGAEDERELLCEPCAAEREQGKRPGLLRVCKNCHRRIAVDLGSLSGVGGGAPIREQPRPLDPTLRRTPLPTQFGTLVDVAAIGDGARSLWLLLYQDGVLVRFDADSGASAQVARVRLTVEEERQPWSGRVPRPRLHASRRGDFVAVCRDYGQFGEVLDLRSGKVTISLDGGAYHNETVPFSFAFAEIDGRVVAVHRSSWNRLDLSDPATGDLLSAREHPPRKEGDAPPAHGLDYFHGALYVSPDQRHLLDDGWVWHPVGMPMVWDLDRWLMDNPWESEDGPSRLDLCVRAYYWDCAMTWIDDRRVVIDGLGDDDRSMLPGARIFDITAKPEPEAEGGVRELSSFPGPMGQFFGHRGRLYSADRTGLSVWDPDQGARVGQLPGFSPTHLHVDANELASVSDGALLRWSLDSAR
ncbi:MAG: hypothetical protein JO332_05820 [Planctomycetaceae bacterium]|nr:hypothetical protein [Planctomycetaceae bacterium]